MTVYIQRKRSGRMAEIFLHRLNVIAVLQGENGKGVPQNTGRKQSDHCPVRASYDNVVITGKGGLFRSARNNT